VTAVSSSLAALVVIAFVVASIIFWRSRKVQKEKATIEQATIELPLREKSSYVNFPSETFADETIPHLDKLVVQERLGAG
jgi:hypothetical protein